MARGLLSTSPDNTDAARLYKRIGFEKTGDLWDDEEIFRFDLAANVE